MNPEEIKAIIQILEEKKLKNIEAFDLKTKSSIIKFIILATCANEKNCRTISYEIEEALKNLNYKISREGDFPGDWIILDAGNFLIEIFTEDTRKYYNLEKLWGDSKNRLAEVTTKKRKRKE
jgi:ribosome-associated protein